MIAFFRERGLKVGTFVAGGFVGLLTGCGSFDGNPNDDSSGRVSVTVEKVPADARCVRIVATGSAEIAQKFSVTPGERATLTTQGVPPGSLTLSGEAFRVACSDVTTTSVPVNITDPAVVAVIADSAATVTFVMRPSENDEVFFAPPGGVWNVRNWNNALWR